MPTFVVVILTLLYALARVQLTLLRAECIYTPYMRSLLMEQSIIYPSPDPVLVLKLRAETVSFVSSMCVFGFLRLLNGISNGNSRCVVWMAMLRDVNCW